MGEDKVEIVEKNGKKYIGKAIIFKYNIAKRLMMTMAFFIVALLGYFFLLIGNWFTVIFGALSVFIGFLSMFDILFFKQLIFSDEYVMKEWFIFGSKKIEFTHLETSTAKRMWTGTIIFRDRNKKSFLQFFMDFETFPIGNDGFKQIRKILIDKKVIKGDEDGWNY